MLNGICFLINYLSFPTGHGSSNPLQLLASVERIQNLPKCCTLVKFDNAGQVFKIHAGCCWTDMVLVKDGKGIAFLKTFFCGLAWVIRSSSRSIQKPPVVVLGSKKRLAFQKLNLYNPNMAPHLPHHWKMFETNLSLACEFNQTLLSLPMKWLNCSGFFGDGKYLLLNATTLHTTDHFAL